MFALIELTAGSRRQFRVQALIKLHGCTYDLDDLNVADRRALMTALDVQGLNAAFSGKLRFSAEGEPLERMIAALEASGRDVSQG